MLREREGVWAALGRGGKWSTSRGDVLEGSGPIPGLPPPTVFFRWRAKLGRAPCLISRAGARGGWASLPGRGLLGDGQPSGYRAGTPRPWEIWDGNGGESSAPGSGPGLGKGRKGPRPPRSSGGQPAGLGDRDRLRAPSGLGLSPAAACSGPGGTGTPLAFAKAAVQTERLLGDGEAGGCGGRGALRGACKATGRLWNPPQIARGSRQKEGDAGVAGGSWVCSPRHPQTKRS